MLSHAKWVDSSHIVVDVDHLRVLDLVHFHVKIHSACLMKRTSSLVKQFQRGTCLSVEENNPKSDHVLIEFQLTDSDESFQRNETRDENRHTMSPWKQLPQGVCKFRGLSC